MTPSGITTGWRSCELGDVITLQRGHDLPETMRRDGAVPIVSSSGPTGLHNEAKAKGPGVVTGRCGTLGEVYYVTEDYWPLNTTLYVKDFKGNDARFIAYYLQTMNLERFNGAGAVPGLNRNHLHKLRIRFPVEATIQQSIVAHLSHFDDLIENNRRRIVLLEEAAQQLYKEWFVRLRFPGHERTKIVDGLPEGWERSSLKALCESVSYGFTASADPAPIGPKFLRITDIVPSVIEWPDVPHCQIPDGKREQFLLRTGDCVVARTGATVGYAKRLHKRFPESIFASYLVRLRPQSEELSYLVGLFVESDAYKSFIMANVGGAAQPNANAQVIARPAVLVPDEATLSAFRFVVEPILDQRDNLIAQNSFLREARDLLLPRLMSGEIEV